LLANNTADLAHTRDAVSSKVVKVLQKENTPLGIGFIISALTQVPSKNLSI